MRIASIDPGVGGAIAIIDGQTPIKLYDMPIQKVKTKTLICPDKLAEIFIESKCEVVVCEQIGASPKMGVSSAYNFGVGFGMIQGVSAGLMIPCYTITPQKWKTFHGLTGKPKDASRQKTLSMFPELKERLKKKKDVDAAESLLLGLAWLNLNRGKYTNA